MARFERADDEAARAWLARIPPDLADSTDLQNAIGAHFADAVEAFLGRRAADGVNELERAAHTFASRDQWGYACGAFEMAANGAVLLGEPAAAAPLADLYDTAPPSALTRYLRIEGGRVRALRARAAGDEDVAADAFAEALAAARSLGRNGHLAPLLADYGAWLVECGRDAEAEPLLDEARALFERMGAKRWLERIDAVRPKETVAA